MSVREWDPLTAPAGEIESIVALLNELLAADLPDDPHWRADGMVEYLSETMPGERRVCWLAEEAGGIVGHANLLLLGDVGVIEVLVHPAARHRGVGHALVATVARRAYAEGISSIGVEVIGGTPAVKFWEALGFRHAYVEMRNVLDLSNVDWARLAEMASVVPAGYRVEYHPGGLTKELLEPYAAAKATRQDTGEDDGELDLRPSSYDAQRLADSLATLNRRGMKPYLVLAIHIDSGEVAALTELVAPRQHPRRGDQYDTIVMPHHTGIGLERAIKARMLCELRVAEPALTEVQTWNAIENDPISGVNGELGFRPDRQWREYEADVLDLINQPGA
jgi:GNAT superfamily N-acetyltransferase